MEPEVHIIEKYFQHVLKCFTMTNIRCERGKEIDLLVIDPINDKKFHVESRVSTTFRLREEIIKKRRRDGVDYFKEDKFDDKSVVKRVKEIFGDTNYEKVLVVYGTKEPSDSFIPKALEKYGIHVLLIADIISELKEEVKVTGSRDDVIRFVELIALGEKEFYDGIESLMKSLEKGSDLSRLGVVKRFRKLRKMKRSEIFKALGGDKKTSTQRLRESLLAN